MRTDKCNWLYNHQHNQHIEQFHPLKSPPRPLCDEPPSSICPQPWTSSDPFLSVLLLPECPTNGIIQTSETGSFYLAKCTWVHSSVAARVSRALPFVGECRCIAQPQPSRARSLAEEWMGGARSGGLWTKMQKHLCTGFRECKFSFFLGEINT